MNDGKLTTAPEIAAYVAAHFVGILAVYVINPIVFAELIAAGHRESIQVVALSMSALVMIAVLLLFLFGRKVLTSWW